MDNAPFVNSVSKLTRYVFPPCETVILAHGVGMKHSAVALAIWLHDGELLLRSEAGLDC